MAPENWRRGREAQGEHRASLFSERCSEVRSMLYERFKRTESGVRRPAERQLELATWERIVERRFRRVMREWPESRD